MLSPRISPRQSATGSPLPPTMSTRASLPTKSGSSGANLGAARERAGSQPKIDVPSPKVEEAPAKKQGWFGR
eukprot:6876108-Prymnesium_polylepis.1